MSTLTFHPIPIKIQEYLINPHHKMTTLLDYLYCEEKCWDDHDDDTDIVSCHGDHGGDHDGDDNHDDHDDGFGSVSYSSSLSHDCLDEEDQLNGLLSKEENTNFSQGGNNLVMEEARREALEWMIRVKDHHNFSVITLVLAANYFDKFMVRFGFKKDLPWMTHLVAVACLSLASKIEETHVPLLLDFQVEHKRIFEARVIQKMELLVLSTLEWKMNAVTPLSYFEHLIRKLKLMTHFHWELLRRCEGLILSAIIDPRYLFYVPSVIAAATMVHTVEEIGLWSNLKHHNLIMDSLKLDKDKVKECYKFIQELSSKAHKRTFHYASPSKSPNHVLDDAISSESSSSCKDSSSISLMKSLEPLTKKCRTMGPTYYG